MWCKHCQQDVPAVGSTDESLVRCARCHSSFSEDSESEDRDRTVDKSASTKSNSQVGADWIEKALLEDWELDDELNEAQRLVTSLGANSTSDTSIRFDAAHVPQRTIESQAPRATSAQSSLFSWCVLSLGLMSFVFGAVLIGWSFFEDRPDLWRLGLPFTLGGQAALIVGLVFQLDGLWRSNREAVASLNELDEQLAELRHATSMLSTTHSSPAKSFYAHMADGASPNLMLADLKGQLDLLANRIANDR